MAPTARRYRNVECCMWDSADFLALSAPEKPSAQWLWLYLLTGPQTGIIPGLYVFSLAAAAERFGWSLRGTQACFSEILTDRAGGPMAKFDDRTRLLWLPKALRERNLPASPNVVRSWRSAWVELPTSPIKQEAARAIFEALRAMDRKSGGFAKAFGEVFGQDFAKVFAEDFGKGSEDPSPNQESGNRSEIVVSSCKSGENLSGRDRARLVSVRPGGMTAVGGRS